MGVTLDGMSLSIITTHTLGLPISVARQIRDSLTNGDSQTQREMDAVICCLTGSLPADMAPDFPMAIATVTNPYTDEADCIGWASATVWDKEICLQAFVAKDHRNKGLATAMTSALVVDKHLSQDMPVGVFSDECARIAKALCFKAIHRYRRCEDGWLKSEAVFDERGRSDEAGLRDAQGAVRTLSLADESSG